MLAGVIVSIIVFKVSLPLSVKQVPENIRSANQQRADQLQTEKDNIMTAMEGFKALLIS